MRAWLDGRLLPVDAGAGWTQSCGVDPFQLVLDLEAGVASELFEASEEFGSVLRLEEDGFQPVEWAGLTILGTGPSDHPEKATLTAVDLRYAWGYGPHVTRSYNVPRKGGAVRRLDGDGEPLAKKQLADDLIYAAYSLKNGTDANSAADVLRDVLDYEDEDGRKVCPFGWRDEDGVLEGRAGPLPPVQDWHLDGRAGPVIATVMAKLGGRVGVRVDPDKKVVLYDRLSGRERELVGLPKAGSSITRGQLTPRVAGGPLWSLQDRRKERPRKVRVFFTIAAEIRVDHVEGGSSSTASDRVESENVVVLPEDVTLSDGRELKQSALLKLDDYLTYLTGKQPTFQGGAIPALTRSRIRKGWLRSVIETYAELDGSGVWAARAAVIRRDFRSLYRITNPWVGRFADLVAYRVSVQDRETGARSLSPAFMDYATWATWRSVASKNFTQIPRDHEAVRNVYANANAASGGSIVGTSLESLRQAPALVEVVDAELGLYRISMLIDFTGTASRHVRSALTKDSVPSHDLTRDNVYLQEGELSSTHEHSIVLTAQPAAPNDNRRLYMLEVDPEDVSGLLPSPGVKRVAEGPVLDYRIPTAREPARFAWEDANAADFVAAFTSALSEKPRALQDALGEPVNLQVIEGIARSVGAQVYAAFEDHVEGGLETGMDASLRLKGTARSVSWGVGRRGATSVVDLPSDPPPIDSDSFLPEGVRRLLDRFVDP